MKIKISIEAEGGKMVIANLRKLVENAIQGFSMHYQVTVEDGQGFVESMSMANIQDDIDIEDVIDVEEVLLLRE